MDRATLASVRTIVAHEDCADGTASAILLHDALPQCEVLFAEYGRSADALPVRPGMLFCDFSPPPARAAEYVAAGAFVLDHHRTARDVVARFGARGIYADETADPGVSGAVLALREVWLTLRADSPDRAFAESFATAAGARDTWQTQSAAWRDGCVQQAALSMFRQDYWLRISLSELAGSWRERYAPIGEQVMAQKRERLLSAIEAGHRFTTRSGLRVLAFNFLGGASDAAEEMHDQVDVIVAFDVVEEAGAVKMRLSLRSHTGFDCGKFALDHGGGGHTRASGCSIAIGPTDPAPFVFLERVFARA